MPDGSPQKPLDYAAIRFPSDRITMADIRRVHPDRFDRPGGERFRQIANDPAFTIELIVTAEHLLAEAAYEAARGSPRDVLGKTGFSRSDFLEDLAEFYATYGVATGARQTEQLVRDIEAQAAAQAAGPKR